MGLHPVDRAEIAYAGKKLKPIVIEDMILIAEYDGEPVAFMMALPDINEFISRPEAASCSRSAGSSCCGG